MAGFNYSVLVYDWLDVGHYYGDEQKVLFEDKHYLLNVDQRSRGSNFLHPDLTNIMDF